MTQKLISMSEKEIERYNIINDLINKKIDSIDAAKQLAITTRHLRRLKVLVKKQGAKGLVNKMRGKESNKKLKIKIKEKIKKLITKKYYDFGATLVSEKLEESYNIKVSKETIRLIMIDMGTWIPKPRKNPCKRHVWRARKDNFGEMQQFDGSYHVWFGKEESCLLLSVDDAAGKITHAKFDYNEGRIAVFNFWKEYIEKNGLPLAIYLDKFSTYKINHKNAVDNKDMMTQFERAMGQLNIRPITAHSPQAKGRVERMFGTLQDRLVKEMRLANIENIEQANDFLKDYILKFNNKFGVIPNRKKDLHKKLSKKLKENLSQIFSIQSERKVNNDYTVRFNNNYYQLNQEQPLNVYKKDRIVIEEHLDNSVKISLREKYLNYTVLPERPKREIDVKLVALSPKKDSHWKPPLNHSWQKHVYNKKTVKITK